MALSAVTDSSASMNSERMPSLMALRLSGRLRVSVAMPSLTFSSISVWSMSVSGFSLL